MSTTQRKGSYATAFIAIVFTFFFWGFVAASNGVLIPMFKSNFALSQFQSQLVDFAFYLAYFVGSLIYFIISSLFGDPLNVMGYKKGLIIGLVVSALGALLFIPAVSAASYVLFLCGLFIIGLGFALLQIVANPFVINLGDPSGGAARLNFAGGINSLGTTIGPVLLAFALYGKIVPGKENVLTLANLQTPYAALSAVLFTLAIIIAFINLPTINDSGEVTTSNSPTTQNRSSVFQYPQLVLGMVAIFIYVGTEVTIQSNLGALLKLPSIKGIDHTQVDKYVSLYWGSLMIGRIAGSLSTFGLNKRLYALLSWVIPFAVFGVVLYFNSLRGADISDLGIYAVWIAVFTIAKFAGQEKPARTLLLFGVAAMLLMLVGLFSTGNIALFSFLSGGLFCSVMWPCIFNLAIAGLGRFTNQGSSLLIMMILGGAIIPPMQGLLADNIGIQLSYWVPFAGFAYLAWYGYGVSRMLKQQGIDYDTNAGNRH
ncbi:MAG: MFS transporter [Chitinophagia bacterium]|nr:MFS transporter [Chitinophagia bacterium]